MALCLINGVTLLMEAIKMFTKQPYGKVWQTWQKFWRLLQVRVELGFMEEELAADMQDDLRCYTITPKVWTFFGRIPEYFVPFHLAYYSRSIPHHHYPGSFHRQGVRALKHSVLPEVWRVGSRINAPNQWKNCWIRCTASLWEVSHTTQANDAVAQC